MIFLDCPSRSDAAQTVALMVYRELFSIPYRLISIQKHLFHNGNLNPETPGECKTAILHCRDVSSWLEAVPAHT